MYDVWPCVWHKRHCHRSCIVNTPQSSHLCYWHYRIMNTIPVCQSLRHREAHTEGVSIRSLEVKFLPVPGGQLLTLWLPSHVLFEYCDEQTNCSWRKGFLHYCRSCCWKEISPDGIICFGLCIVLLRYIGLFIESCSGNGLMESKLGRFCIG